MDKKNEKKEPMDKKDILCYVGSVVFLILALLPFLLRKFDLNYSEDGPLDQQKPIEEPKLDIKRLSCNKEVPDTEFSYRVEVVSIYANNVVKNETITYYVTINEGSDFTIAEIEIPEYKKISEITSNAITKSETENTLQLVINYDIDQNLRQKTELYNHNRNLDVQRSTFEKNGYQCTVGNAN